MILIGSPPKRIDIDAFVGSPIYLTIPVLDDNDTPVTSLAGWTVAAQVSPPLGTKISLTAVIVTVNSAPNVRVTATSAETAAWTWARYSAPWDVVLTDPSGSSPPPLCRGWIRLQRTVTVPTP